MRQTLSVHERMVHSGHIHRFARAAVVLLVAGGLAFVLTTYYKTLVEKKLWREKSFAQETSIKKLRGANGKLSTDLKDSRDQILTLQTQLSGSQSERARVAADLESKEGEVIALRSDIARYQVVDHALRRHIRNAESAYGELRTQYNELVQIAQGSKKGMRELKKRLDALSRVEDAVSLGTVVIRK